MKKLLTTIAVSAALAAGTLLGAGSANASDKICNTQYSMDGTQTYELCVWIGQDGRRQGSKTICSVSTGQCVTRDE